MWGFIGWKAAGFPSTPHSTQLKFSTPPTLERKMNTEGKWKESKVFTCWILLLLWTRLWARGCHWHKVWTFLRTRPGHGEAPRGAVSEEILLQPCDWSVDSKLWWKRAERLSSWNATYAWHCESAFSFFHTSLSSLSKAPLLQCYIKRWLWFVCVWVRFPMSPSISQWFCWTHNSLSLCVTSRWHSYSNTDGRDTPSGSPLGGGGAEICSHFFHFKIFYFPLEDECFMPGDIQVQRMYTCSIPTFHVNATRGQEIINKCISFEAFCNYLWVFSWKITFKLHSIPMMPCMWEDTNLKKILLMIKISNNL